MGELLTEAQFGAALRDIQRSAFRLELQPAYNEPSEVDTLARFASGDRQPPTELADFRAWFDQIRGQVSRGITVARVRVHDDPPTDYQRWERWAGQWNIEAGERIAYLTRQQAHGVGLLPAAGDTDWWLLDEERLIIMSFDQQHRRVRNELTTNRAAIARACKWRDLAIQAASTQGERIDVETTRR